MTKGKDGIVGFDRRSFWRLSDDETKMKVAEDMSAEDVVHVIRLYENQLKALEKLVSELDDELCKRNNT